jgi:hypothetical protein
LNKVRTFINNLAKNFADYADIEEVTSVDEQIIPFKGQLGIKVYIKNKPKKWGVKVRNCLLHLPFCSLFCSLTNVSPDL